jgi:hypothetical protein
VHRRCLGFDELDYVFLAVAGRFVENTAEKPLRFVEKTGGSCCKCMGAGFLLLIILALILCHAPRLRIDGAKYTGAARYVAQVNVFVSQFTFTVGFNSQCHFISQVRNSLNFFIFEFAKMLYGIE